MRHKILLLAIPAALVAACAAPPTIRTAKVVAARVHDPARPRQVAVLPLEGDSSGSFTAALEKSLAGISIDGRPYFTLVDQGKVAAAVASGRLSGGPLTDTQAAALGTATGAAGVLTGAVTVEYDEQQPKERRTICLRADDDGGCRQWGDAAVTCTLREGRMTFAPRLIETQSGRISYARTIRARSSDLACSDTPPSASGRAGLICQAEELLLKEFRKDIAPYFVTIEAEIMSSSGGIPSGEGRDLFIRGVLAAEENRPDRACELWEKAGHVTSSSPSLRYDLGLCRELAGDLESAVEEYRKAAELLGGPDPTVTTALDRVRTEMANRARAAGDGSR